MLFLEAVYLSILRIDEEPSAISSFLPSLTPVKEESLLRPLNSEQVNIPEFILGGQTYRKGWAAPQVLTEHTDFNAS